MEISGVTLWSFHNRNYHLLNYNGDYIFRYIPIGIISDNGVEAKVYLPRASKSLKQKYVQEQKKNFLDEAKPRILLCSEGKRVAESIEKIIVDEEVFDNLDIKVETDLIIFENIDRFVNSHYSAKQFLKWISPLLGEKRFIFHFSNPESKFIQMVKEETNSLIIPLSTLRNNIEVKKASLEYFEKERSEVEWSILEKYNIDRVNLYQEETAIVPEPPLEAGNINHHLGAARYILSKIEEEKISNKRLYYTIRYLFFTLPNLAINPSKYKIRYGDTLVRWRYYTIPQLLHIFKERLLEEDEEIRGKLKELISEIYGLYLELKECRRYGEERTYSRIGKEYKILEILASAVQEDGNRVKIATYSPIERNLLEEEIARLGLENGFEVRTIDQISKSAFGRSKTTLLLPGPLRMKYLSELALPYKKIIILSYEGKNYDLVKEQIDLLHTYSFEREDTSINHLKEVYDFLGISKDGVFKDYYIGRKRKEMQPDSDEEKRKTKEKKDVEIDFLDRIRDIVKRVPHTLYREFEDEVSRIEEKIRNIDEKELEDGKNQSSFSYGVSLRRISDGNIIEKLLPGEKTYLYLEDAGGDVHEGTPKVLQPSYFVVILDGDERKTLLDLIIEIFNLEESVDKHLIELWKNKLAAFIEERDLSYRDFYRMYRENGGRRDYATVLNWAKGGVLGPNDPFDLYLVGKVLKDDDIMENHKIIDREVKNLRKIHRTTGRKLRKIIKEVLNGNMDSTKLDYEEYLLYEKVKDGIYEILELKRL